MVWRQTDRRGDSSRGSARLRTDTLSNIEKYKRKLMRNCYVRWRCSFNYTAPHPHFWTRCHTGAKRVRLLTRTTSESTWQVKAKPQVRWKSLMTCLTTTPCAILLKSIHRIACIIITGAKKFWRLLFYHASTTNNWKIVVVVVILYK